MKAFSKHALRSSTKYEDSESDLIYYGHRYLAGGRWLSRDPLTEPGFSLLTTGDQPSQNDDEADAPSESFRTSNWLIEGGPDVYALAANDPVNNVDTSGLVVIAFNGAEVWGSHVDLGNVGVQEIVTAVNAVGPFRSLDIASPYLYLLNYFKTGNGRCNTNEAIKIFGYSWGGTSAVKLSRWLGRSQLRNHEIDVYTIDPVSKLRFPPTVVPHSVTEFWNRYQTAGNGVTIAGYPVHGRFLRSHAHHSDQVDLNSSDPNGLSHFSIVFAVKDELISLLSQ